MKMKNFGPPRGGALPLRFTNAMNVKRFLQTAKCKQTFTWLAGTSHTEMSRTNTSGNSRRGHESFRKQPTLNESFRKHPTWHESLPEISDMNSTASDSYPSQHSDFVLTSSLSVVFEPLPVLSPGTSCLGRVYWEPVLHFPVALLGWKYSLIRIIMFAKISVWGYLGCKAQGILECPISNCKISVKVFTLKSGPYVHW